MSRSLVTTLIRRLLLAGGLLTLANVIFVTAYYSSNPRTSGGRRSATRSTGWLRR